MSIIIAQKQEKYIRYITVETDYISHFDWVLNTIRNFYKTPEKVSALIDLGNLEWLGPSPYKKNKGDEDIVNCDSKIRDRKLSPGKHGSSTVTSEEQLMEQFSRSHYTYTRSDQRNYRINCCFLFEDGKWYALVGGHKESIVTVDKSFLRKEILMDGLNVYYYKPESDHQKLQPENFFVWSQVQKKADEKNRIYYIFRNNRLISVIYPKQENLSVAV